MDCTFEKMRLEDLDEVLKIATASFNQPWTKAMFENEILKNPFSEQFLVKVEGENAGYLCMWSLFDEAHILDFAIDPQFRRKGLGEKVILNVIERIKENKIKKIFLEVRASNEAAKSLYKKVGFLNLAERKGYYSNPTEDALIFQWKATEADRTGFPEALTIFALMREGFMSEYQKDDELVKQIRKENKKFRDFEKEHEQLSKKLEALNKRKTLLPEEEVEVKRIHKEKLVFKDQLKQMIKEFKEKKV
ncbi:MAG: ribosomal protein S18-alanine N-acetyltransferase [Nitrospirae bacterium]|nr:ribosomal protein S18-alanine N-acetyltransferase [Nitrospirota bacterium]MBI3351051.1 ribosomal protein S18-alanine N-acetyltransferase [Nitrospirota bacterium]